MSKEGFTLIGLIVVLGVLALLSGIAVPAYNRWNKKASIENDTRQIYRLLNEARSKAFTEKCACGVTWNGSKLELRCDTDNDGAIGGEPVVMSVDLKNQFSTFAPLFTKEGISRVTGNIHASDISAGPTYSCVQVDYTRIRMGKWDGTNCVLQ